MGPIMRIVFLVALVVTAVNGEASKARPTSTKRTLEKHPAFVALRKELEELKAMYGELKAGSTSSVGVSTADKTSQTEGISANNLNLASGGKKFPAVRKLSSAQRKRILITGGAGFVGSHLTDVLMKQGHEVTVMDNFFTGRKANIEHWVGHPNFELAHHDVVEEFMEEVDEIYHLASPASPPHYMYNPIKTIKTNTIGTINMLGLARRVGARILLASTSEIYGDPEVHPQVESYRGNVNTIGPRACYDEAKRVAETLMYAYQKQGGVEVRVARIFNTFGPRMNMGDGRVVSNFILQAIQNKNITVYGTGNQTRSFQYVSDLVAGLVALMNGNYSLPTNIGNPDEYTMLEFAKEIISLTESKSHIIFKPLPKDDPMRRRPDITVAKDNIGWEPVVKVRDGLVKAIEYFKKELLENEADGESSVRKSGPYGHMADYAKNSQA
eukprot:m.258854 g.258854  ORF g.258854 m.258854 type:complete len:441 (-) comp37198_c0_seq1:96-1418(-)